VTGGDAGELVVCACNDGVAHPPGYPLFTMLGHGAVRWLQPLFESAAYRVHVLNAALGAGAATFLFAATFRLTRHSVWPGVFAGLGFALSHTPWLYSIQGEVFPLNNFLVACVTYLTIRFYELMPPLSSSSSSVSASSSAAPVAAAAKKGNADVTPDAALVKDVTLSSLSSPLSSTSYMTVAYLGSLACGLCATNQHTTLFVIAPTALAILVELWRRALLIPARLSALVALLLVGLSPYARMVWRAHHSVIDSWGDQRHVDGFLTHFLRREYGTFQLAASEISEDPGMLFRLSIYVREMFFESRFVVPPLALYGCFLTLRRRRKDNGKGKGAVALRTRLDRDTINTNNGGGAPPLLAACRLLFVCFISYVVVFHKLANLDMRPLFLGVQARFWMQSNLYVFMWAGVGLDATVSVATTAVVALRGKRHELVAALTIAYLAVHSEFAFLDFRHLLSFLFFPSVIF
jgi:hypothetical protein